MLWTLAALLGVGPGTSVSTNVSLALGALAAVLGTVGLVQCHRSGATGRAACGWAIGLGIVFGALPSALLLAMVATWPRW